MAVTLTLKASGQQSAGTTCVTSAVTGTTAKVQFLCFATGGVTGDNPVPTVSGWVSVNVHNYNPGDIERTIGIFRQIGTGTSDTATITFAQSMLECEWAWLEADGADAGGTAGANSVVQSVAAGVNTSGLTALATLAAFSSADNATLGICGFAGNVGAITVGTGFTELNLQSGNVNGDRFLVEWKNSNDTTVDASRASGADWWGAIGIELKDAAVAYTPPITPAIAISMR